MFESTWMFSSFSLNFCLSSRSTFCPTVLFVHVLVGVGFLPRGAPLQPHPWYALEFSYFFPPSRLEFRFGRWHWALGGPGRLRGFFLYSVRRSNLRADRPTVRGRPLHACGRPQRLAAACTDVSRGRPCILDILGHLSKESWRRDVGVRRSLVKNDKRHQPTFQESSSNTPMIGLIQGKVNWSNCLVSDLNM